MNPIEINIKVGLEDNTLKILTELMTAAVRTEDKQPDPMKEAKDAVANANKAVDEAEKAMLNAAIKVNRAKSAEPAPVEQKPAPIAQKESPVEQNPSPSEQADDMPEEIAEISDVVLKQIVTETRQRVGSAAPIRKLMTEKFGIKLSTECPQEKRQEFINALKEL